MRYRKSTSVSLDETTANDAGEWAKKEHLQLSSYIEEAVEMRNKWHERNEEKEKMKTNLLTKEQAKKELLSPAWLPWLHFLALSLPMSSPRTPTTV